MAKESARKLTASERGSTLVVVMLMLLLVLPLSLILGRLVMQWQRGAAQFTSFIELEYAARAGFEDALRRLGMNELKLGLDELMEFQLEGLEGHGARVRVSREADAVLSLEGRILEGIEATKADLDHIGVDPDLRRVYIFRGSWRSAASRSSSRARGLSPGSACGESWSGLRTALGSGLA